MPPKRARTSRAPRRRRGPDPDRAARARHKRQMINRLIALEKSNGEPREMPRDVDISGHYTLANLRAYMGPGLEAALKAKAEVQRKAGPAFFDWNVGVEKKAGPTDSEQGRVMEQVRIRKSMAVRVTTPERKNAQEKVQLPRHITGFRDLPTEVREAVYRDLLVSPSPIVVHNGWSTIYKHQRARPVLHTAILRTCHGLYVEGMRVLYGENHFEYLIRDATPAEPSTAKPEVAPEVAEDEGSDGEYEDAAAGLRVPQHVTPHDINIQRHGPLMRHLDLRAESNRSTQEYLRTAAKAVTTFVTLAPVRANVHTLRISVRTAWRAESSDFAFADWFAPDTALMAALVRLPCRFLEFVVGTPAGREVVIVVSREYGALVRRARRGDNRFVQENEELRRAREKNAAAEYETLMGVGKRIGEEGEKDRALLGAGEGEGEDEDWDEDWNEDEEMEMGDGE